MERQRQNRRNSIRKARFSKKLAVSHRRQGFCATQSRRFPALMLGKANPKLSTSCVYLRRFAFTSANGTEYFFFYPSIPSKACCSDQIGVVTGIILLIERCVNLPVARPSMIVGERKQSRVRREMVDEWTPIDRLRSFLLGYTPETSPSTQLFAWRIVRSTTISSP